MIEHQSHPLDLLFFREMYCKRHTREKYPSLQKPLQDFGKLTAEAITLKISGEINTLLANSTKT